MDRGIEGIAFPGYSYAYVEKIGEFVAKLENSKMGVRTTRYVYSLGDPGADLGFLVWWGCRFNCAQSARKFLRPRPLSMSHAHF